MSFEKRVSGRGFVFRPGARFALLWGAGQASAAPQISAQPSGENFEERVIGETYEMVSIVTNGERTPGPTVESVTISGPQN